MAIGRRKFIVFAAITIALVTVVGVVLMLAADLVLHTRAERSAGLNRWGYRGPVLGRKQPGEVRIAMLGGSTAFGYGVVANESIPALLGQRLNARHGDRTWTGVNLAYNNEGAHAFLQNLTDFAFINYDIVVLYEGYNDLLGDEHPNLVTVRQQSPVFRTTGYFPILPLWLNERSLMIRAGGDVNQAYANERDPNKAVFRPNIAARATASALDAAAVVAGALERQFEHASAPVPSRAHADSALGCPAPWSNYCESQYRAIQYALANGKKVLVVGQPALASEALRERHARQQAALSAMLQQRYGSEPRVRYLALGRIVDLNDVNVSFDQMHLNPTGNGVVADALVDPVAQLESGR